MSPIPTPKAEREKCPDPYCGKDEWFCPTHFHEEPQSECPLKQYGIFHESGKCDCYKPPKDTEEGKCPNCGAVEQNWIKKCPACGAEGCYQCIDIHACVPTPTRGGWEEDVYAILPILDTNLTTDSKMAAIKKIVGDLIARERKEIKFRGYVIRGSKEILK